MLAFFIDLFLPFFLNISLSLSLFLSLLSLSIPNNILVLFLPLKEDLLGKYFGCRYLLSRSAVRTGVRLDRTLAHRSAQLKRKETCGCEPSARVTDQRESERGREGIC